MNVKDYIDSGILELYAAGVLSNEESAEVEGMLKEYPELIAELEAIESSLISFAEAHADKPGDKLFDKILNQIHESEDVRPIKLPIAGGDYEEDNIIPLHPFHENQRRRYISLMAASVALFMMSSLLNVYFFTKWKKTDIAYSSLLQTQKEMADKINVTSNKLADASKQIESYQSPQMKVVMLKAVEKGKDYEAIAMWNPQMKSLQLKVMHLPAPPAGKQYQLWALDNGKPIDAGMINTMGQIESMKSIASAQTFAITLENEGGSPSPTLTAMVVAGNI